LFFSVLSVVSGIRQHDGGMGNVTICGTMPLDNRPALVHTLADNVKAVGAGDQGRSGES